jgi:hypothetical protein
MFAMKKFLTYGFILVIYLAVSCKKESQNHKVYLLQQQIVDDRVEGNPLDTTTYAYDDQNRMISITAGTPPHRTNFTITYDSQGRVSIGRKFNNSGGLVIQYDFFYKADSTGYNFHGPIGLSDTAVFTFNEKKQVIRIQTRNAGYQLYAYDDTGNVITSDGFDNDGTNGLLDHTNYTYDHQKNPFSKTPPGNYFLMYIAYSDATTLINNVARKNADIYTYTYNADGFPVSVIADVGRAKVPIYYNYIVK